MYLIATVVLLDGEYVKTYLEHRRELPSYIAWIQPIPGLDYWTAVRPHGCITLHYTCVSLSIEAT